MWGSCFLMIDSFTWPEDKFEERMRHICMHYSHTHTLLANLCENFSLNWFLVSPSVISQISCPSTSAPPSSFILSHLHTSLLPLFFTNHISARCLSKTQTQLPSLQCMCTQQELINTIVSYPESYQLNKASYFLNQNLWLIGVWYAN